MSLADETCIPCRGGVTPMTLGEARARLIELDPGWMVNSQGHLERVLRFRDFAEALSFVNRLGAEAESQGHHPMLHFTWGMCTVEWWSHEVGGLHESDFIMAARTDRLL